MLELYLIFVLGLVSSLHCTQMCGPIVLAFSLPLATQPFRIRIASQVAYNGGRLLTYSGLGAIAGGLGSAIARITGFESAAALTGGAFMIGAGLLMAGILKPSPLVNIAKPSPFTRRIGKLLVSPAASTKFGMGALLGFLPCGLIYAALMKSVASGSAVFGALTMLAFGLGTAAPLLTLGLFSATIGRWFGRWSTQLAAVSVTLMGVLLVWRGLMPATHHHH